MSWAFVVFVAMMALPIQAAQSATAPLGTESIHLSNPACDAVISIKPFVRLISFRLKASRSHLLDFASPNPVIKGKAVRPLFVAGAKFWYAPEIPDSHLFGVLPGIPVRSGRTVEVTLEPDTAAGLQGRIRYVLNDDQPCVTIVSTLRNIGTVEKDASCWWPIAFERRGQMEATVIPWPIEPALNLHFWSFSASASDPACHVDGQQVTLNPGQTFRQKQRFKVGLLSKEIVLTEDDCLYRMTALDPVPKPGMIYPHGGSPAILYCDQRSDFCEAELSGPLIPLRPGEETSFTFAISLASVSTNWRAPLSP